jgi:hypothetical protein
MAGRFRLPSPLMPCFPCLRLRSNGPLTLMIAGVDEEGMPEEWVHRRVEQLLPERGE